MNINWNIVKNRKMDVFERGILVRELVSHILINPLCIRIDPDIDIPRTTEQGVWIHLRIPLTFQQAATKTIPLKQIEKLSGPLVKQPVPLFNLQHHTDPLHSEGLPHLTGGFHRKSYPSQRLLPGKGIQGRPVRH